MDVKIGRVFMVALLISVGLVSVVSAQGNATSTTAKTAYHGNATSTENRNDDRGNATSTGAKAGAGLTSESHRSAVALFVKTLLAVAGREGGIGTEVRAIAMAQQDSASTTDRAIAKVEAKSGASVWLFGSDYQSLGELRSEMVTTQNNINKLKTLLTRTDNDADKAELTTQIKALEDSETKIEAFVKAHEDSFSLFGWFVKWFK